MTERDLILRRQWAGEIKHGCIWGTFYGTYRVDKTAKVLTLLTADNRSYLPYHKRLKEELLAIGWKLVSGRRKRKV